MAETSSSRAELLEEIATLRRRIEQLESSHKPALLSMERDSDLQAFLDEIPDGILVANAETRQFHRANRQMSRLLGYQADELQRLGVTEIHPAEDLPRIIDFFDRQARGEIDIAPDIPVKRKDGSIFYADINSFAVNIDGVKCVAGVFRDVTHRRNLESQLRASETAMRAVLDATTESALLIGTDGTFLALNKIAAQRLGGTVQDLVGTSAIEFARQTLSVDTVEASMQSFRSILQSTTATRLEIDHSGRIFDTTMYPVQDERGNITSIAVFSRDITEQKMAEEHLRASEAAMRAVLDSSTESIFLLDADTNVIAINRTAAQRLNSSVGELTGVNTEQYLHSIMPADAADARLRQIRDVLRTGKASHREDERNGRLYDTHTHPVWDEEGKVVSVAVFARDITEQKMVEEQLRARDATMQAILDAATESILLVDTDNQVVTINETSARRLGKRVDEIMGSDIRALLHEIMHSQAADARIQSLNAVMQSGEPVLFEDEFGSRIMSHSLLPVMDTEHNVTGVVIFARDVTEQRKAENALKESETWYRSLIEMGATVYAVLDPDGTIRYESPMLKRVYGWEPGEVVGSNVLEMVHPEDVEYAKERLAGLLKKPGAVEEAEVRYKHKNGSWLTIAVSGVNLIDEPAVGGIVLTSHDITGRKELEDAVSQSERRYRTLVESAGESIAAVDRDGTFLFMNTIAAERLGSVPDETIGKTMWDFFPARIADQQMRSIRKVIDSAQGQTLRSITEVQGEKRWYNTTIEPIAEEDGTPRAALVIARDIHAIQQAELELAELRQRMARAERLASMGTIAATLSHRVTQPLTAITLSVENALAELEGIETPDSITRGLERGLDGASQIGSIIENLRNLARSSEDSTREPVDLDLLVNDVFRLLGHTAQDANVSLNASGIGQLPPVLAGRFEIEQAFFALVQNAIQAADGVQPHNVTISGSCTDREVELKFSDDCAGIPPENLDKVFEPFFTTKTLSKGTGLGLSIAEQIINRTGGRIRFESRLGKGSTFIVTLPRTDQNSH